MTNTNDTKLSLLNAYVSCTLNVLETDTVDATIKKMLKRLAEIDELRHSLRQERDHITAALASIGYRPPNAAANFYTREEGEYGAKQPFKNMSLTDACLKVLKDRSRKEPAEQWLDKNQVEYLVVRGGYEFKTEDSLNSVNITLRRLASDGYCEMHAGKGSRSSRFKFVKDRLPMT